MPLTYRSDGRFARDFDGLYDAEVVLFDPRIDRDLQRVGERFRYLDESLRWPDLLVVRGSHAEFRDSLEGDPVLPELARDVPVLGLAGSHDRAAPGPALFKPSWSRDPPFFPELAELRACELEAILSGAEAIWRLDGWHFVLPSGDHAEAFIRVAEAFYDVLDVVRIADWVLGELTGDGGLVADTGSLLALLSTVQFEARRRFGWDIPVGTLSEYPTELPSLIERMRAMQAVTGRRGGELVFVISVSSSGRLAQLVDRHMDAGHKIVTICETGNPPAPSAPPYFMAYPIERWRPGSDARCPRCGDLQRAYVDPRSYELRRELDLKVHKEPVRGVRFWEIADRADAVRLHYTSRMGPGARRTVRHHPVYLDIANLLRDKEFRRKSLRKLRSLGRPDAVLIPEHSTTTDLELLVREAFPRLGEGDVHRITGARVSDDLASNLAECHRILVLDDALVSGDTLIAIRRNLYARTRSLDVSPEVSAFVIVSRPTGPADKRRVQRNYGIRANPAAAGEGLRRLVRRVATVLPRTLRVVLRKPSSAAPGVRFLIDSVEEVFLPSRCPWCVELDTLRRARQLGLDERADARALERINHLMRAQLEDPMLLAPTGSRDKTKGSLLGEVAGATAFAAASHWSQETANKLEAARQGREFAVLDGSLIVDAFYDSLILSGMLRTLERRHIRGGGRDAAVGETLSHEPDTLGHGCLIELGWAAVLGRLPPAPVRQMLRDDPDHDDANHLLLSLLSLLQPEE